MTIDKNSGNFWAGILFLILASLVAASCTTQKGFLKYAYDHPDKVAELCAKEFPVTDSVGKPEINYLPAHNLDHRAAIDSIVQEAEKLKEQLNQAEQNATSAEELKTVIRNQKAQNTSLLAQVKKLQDLYKPCEPDTLSVTLPVYRKSLAEITDLKNKLKSEHDAKVKVEAEKDEALKQVKKLEKEIKTLRIISGVLALLLIIGLFIIIRR